MHLRSGSFDFSKPLSGSGPRSASKTEVFPRAVKAATAGITAHTVGYSGEDHHLGRVEVRLEATTNANTVTVEGILGLQDWSGNWDDEYEGRIDFVVVAELEPISEPPPRGDLGITGLELNQAVQFFRSFRFLDPANVRPDNSIWLIARKNTGVRVYVDWDASAGLPPIAHLTGQLTVQTAVTTLTLDPINAGKSIVPKRDVNINPALVGDTLNFLIPAAQCQGTVEVSGRVWDLAAPDSKSGEFRRTLVFVPVKPLNLFLVGVNLIGLPNLPENPPKQSTIAGALSLLVKTYPRGDIVQTGFTTMNFGGVPGGMSASGCGAVFNALLDKLRDLKGGSNDVYYGALPAGAATVPGVVGCSPVGGGVATSFVDRPLTIPHEIGHALGRRHCPCKGCSPPAQDTDPEYPQYGNFSSDSIGVFGFDATAAGGVVFDPASTLDFMTAFLPPKASPKAWISPYTYRALLDGAAGGPAPGSPSQQVDARGQAMTLFLGLSIDRQRQVTRRPSFHHPAEVQGRGDCRGPFVVEFLDERRSVLDCAPLHCVCAEGGCTCWPKELRDAIPYPAGARFLVVWEGDTSLYEEAIPDPPYVKITGTEAREDGLLLRWTSNPAQGLWYVVHWLDKKAGVFRGVAPRLEDTSLLLPTALFAHGPDLEVCVLATSGIATGRDCAAVRLPNLRPRTPGLGLVGVDPTGGVPQRVPCVLTVLATDSAGRRAPIDQVAWYDGGGAELARGDQLDLRSLGPGPHLVRAVARGLADRPVAKSWVVERTPDGCLVHRGLCDPDPKGTKDDHPHPHPTPRPCPP